MRLVEAEATVSDLDSFIAVVGEVADETGATIQAFDARYVVDREHLERATELADRAIARGNEIARDRAVEILLYASGRRQINRAFEIGVSEGTLPVVILVDGGDEADAEAALFDRLDLEPAETLGDYDESARPRRVRRGRDGVERRRRRPPGAGQRTSGAPRGRTLISFRGPYRLNSRV